MTKLPRGLAATFLAFALSNAAHAVPIYFDFTGTITGSSAGNSEPNGPMPSLDGFQPGATISGGFNFESDRLYDAGTFGSQHIWIDWQPTNLAAPLAFLDFNGLNVSIPAFSGQNYSDITFNGGCTPQGCPPNTGENFILFASSMDHDSIPPDFTGNYSITSIMFFSLASNSLPDYPWFESFDYFDDTTVDPFSIVSLPLYDTFGLYATADYTCVVGSCTSQNLQMQFSTDSFTRGIGERVSVPEPGTLGLMAAAGLGLLLFGRRRRLLQR